MRWKNRKQNQELQERVREGQMVGQINRESKQAVQKKTCINEERTLTKRMNLRDMMKPKAVYK